jgi:hypothetical protein
LLAQDKPPVLPGGTSNALMTKDTVPLDDSAIAKKNALNKAVQPEISDSTPAARSHLQLNLVYESNDVYNGRSDSSRLPLITPKISYLFKSGFAIDLSVGYNTREPSPQVNQYTLDGSYSFNPGNYSGEVTASAFVYSKLSGSTTAEQRGSLAYNSGYDFGFIQPSLNLTWTLTSTAPDYQVTFALDHEFDFFNSKLSVDPTATMNAGTQNAYNAYYKNRRFDIPRPGQPPLTEYLTITGEVLNSSEFQILDYELSAPVNYTAGKWVFNFTPTYAFPVHPAQVKITAELTNHTIVSRTFTQNLPNIYYYQLGVTYSF